MFWFKKDINLTHFGGGGGGRKLDIEYIFEFGIYWV